MEQSKSILQKESDEFLKEYPELYKFNNRLHTIAELTKDAANERDLELMRDSFETIFRMQDRLFGEIITHLTKSHTKCFDDMTDNCRRWKEIANKFEDALNQERNENRQIFDNLCAAFVVNPRAAFETVLRFIERSEKTEHQDGQENLSWTLKFSLPARLHMAWKLIFY